MGNLKEGGVLGHKSTASLVRRFVGCSVAVGCVAVPALFVVRATMRRVDAERLDSSARLVELPPGLFGPHKSDDTCVWWLSAAQVASGERLGSGWRFCVTDLKLGKQMPLQGLTRAFNSTRGEAFSIIPSRDGRKVIWSVPARRPGSYSYAVATISGSNLRFWTTPHYRVTWSADGMSWLAYTDDAQDSRSPVAELYDYKSLCHTSIRVSKSNLPAIFVTMAFANLVPNGLAVVETSWDGGVQHLDSISVDTLDLLRGFSKCAEHPIVLPDNQEIDEVLVSPDGKLIVWQMRYRSESVFTRLCRRFNVASGERLKTGLWIARTDGSHVHELGSMAIEKNSPPGDPTSLYIRNWLPGDTGLVYSYNNGLYVLDLSADEAI